MSSARPAQKHRRECQFACYAVKSSKTRNGFGYSSWRSLDPVAALADRKVDSAICLGARCFLFELDDEFACLTQYSIDLMAV